LFAKIRRRRNRSAGIALVSVLRLLLLLSGLAATVAYVTHVESLLAHTQFNRARAEAAANAGIINTISQMSDEDVRRHPSLGSAQTWDFDGAKVVITVMVKCLDQLLFNPRIDYLNPTALKVLRISGGERRAAGASYRGNHPVELADAAPRSASRCSYLGVVARGVLIETQHPPGKVVGKDSERSIPQFLPALPVWHQSNAVKNLTFRYSAGEHRSPWLRVQPRHDTMFWCGT
jgi:hypothetical protein